PRRERDALAPGRPDAEPDLQPGAPVQPAPRAAGGGHGAAVRLAPFDVGDPRLRPDVGLPPRPRPGLHRRHRPARRGPGPPRRRPDPAGDPPRRTLGRVSDSTSEPAVEPAVQVTAEPGEGGAVTTA